MVTIFQKLTEISYQMQKFDDQVTECLHLLWNFSKRLKDYEKNDLMMDRLPYLLTKMKSFWTGPNRENW